MEAVNMRYRAVQQLKKKTQPTFTANESETMTAGGSYVYKYLCQWKMIQFFFGEV